MYEGRIEGVEIRSHYRARIAPRPGVNKRSLGYRASQVLAYVAQVMAIEGRAPSYSMICEELDMERSNLCVTIARLERRGLLSRTGSGRVRRIRLT